MWVGGAMHGWVEPCKDAGGGGDSLHIHIDHSRSRCPWFETGQSGCQASGPRYHTAQLQAMQLMEMKAGRDELITYASIDTPN